MVSKLKVSRSKEKSEEIPKEIYIPIENRQHIFGELRLMQV